VTIKGMNQVVVEFIQEESQDCCAWKPGHLWSIGVPWVLVSEKVEAELT
jgi:hypothetical protein